MAGSRLSEVDPWPMPKRAVPPFFGVIAGTIGLLFLVSGGMLFFTVANARLSDRFRAEEYRNRLRAVGLRPINILLSTAGQGFSWRERAFCAFFEEGRPPEDAEAVCRLAAELGWALDPAALRSARRELEARTVAAAEAMVTGVPTFVLGGWPFGGIQSEDSMLRVLERFAARTRRGELA